MKKKNKSISTHFCNYGIYFLTYVSIFPAYTRDQYGLVKYFKRMRQICVEVFKLTAYPNSQAVVHLKKNNNTQSQIKKRCQLTVIATNRYHMTLQHLFT